MHFRRHITNDNPARCPTKFYYPFRKSPLYRTMSQLLRRHAGRLDYIQGILVTRGINTLRILTMSACISPLLQYFPHKSLESIRNNVHQSSPSGRIRLGSCAHQPQVVRSYQGSNSPARQRQASPWHSGRQSSPGVRQGRAPRAYLQPQHARFLLRYAFSSTLVFVLYPV